MNSFLNEIYEHRPGTNENYKILSQKLLAWLSRRAIWLKQLGFSCIVYGEHMKLCGTLKPR